MLLNICFTLLNVTTDRDSIYKRHKYANICTSNFYTCLYLQTLADTFWQILVEKEKSRKRKEDTHLSALFSVKNVSWNFSSCETCSFDLIARSLLGMISNELFCTSILYHKVKNHFAVVFYRKESYKKTYRNKAKYCMKSSSN